MSNVTALRKRPPAIKLGDRARIARREMGLTQPKFVALLAQHLPSVNDKSYSTWETGTTPEDAVAVADALEKVTGYSWTWFLRGIEEAPRPDGPDEGLTVHPLGLEPRTHWIRDNVRFVEFGSAAA